ncbi:MAG: polysaccharide deacetylase [Rhodocyclaceae bacterium]|jgi:peptidoglycan/xylan/chitin deacetylase (PgdA/CDA1 family)|nr:polysaccharide deacetylase [Rhodocyclaceae bacterium]MCE2980119.1 polysaccharide deacetylase [Betaproteobacteria bacterium]MCA3075812.1 polysaccharide deacetylase [Rhodocyclaceae bacterium]MCA3091215.1 polysaccharide deacetylase [Rhodocyclaceae bacterium]MCA3095290.1 polysaccharide deacetylase [Rhodocyclaceae bacterium]
MSKARRHLVCLTFDFDAISGFIARGTPTPSAISRGEFGPRVSAPRLLKMLGQRGLPTTWFVPGHTAETFPDAVASVARAGHEIGHHGWKHVPPATLSREEEENELVRGIAAIERTCGERPTGYRSPSWDLSPHSIELMLKHGFTYDSSMMGDDYTPYFARQGDIIELEQPAVFGKPSNLLEMPISWSTDDAPHFEFMRYPNAIRPGNMNADQVLGNWIADFDYMQRELDWGVLTYTCHPFIIGRGHRILMLEKLVDTLLARGAVFVRMDVAAAEYRARVAAGEA